MHRIVCDVAIVGAGTAGLAAQRAAGRAGARTLLIEQGPQGTTCARVGCMPSKLLVAAADAAHAAARAPLFGIDVPGGVRVDGPRVLARLRRERDRFVGSVVDALEEIPTEERLSGTARFVGPTALEVGGRRVEARSVVVATGAEPRRPPQLEHLGHDVLVSDDVFELRDLPRSLAIFGAGLVALELGQALSRLGVDVRLFSPEPRVGPFTDPALQRAARDLLGAELALELGVDYRVSRAAEGFRVAWRTADVGREAVFQAVLAASGRRPCLAVLDLPAAGIPLDDGGAPRIDASTLQCGDTPVFVAGDANDERPFLHEASDEGAIAGHNAARFPDVESHARRTRLSIVFTDPQMAMVGRPFEELDLDRTEIGTVSFADQGRARITARNAGIVRLYADRGTARLVGAEMLGPSIEHMAHLVAWAVQRGLRVPEIHELPFYHPVIEEGLRTALRDLCARLELSCESPSRSVERGASA